MKYGVPSQLPQHDSGPLMAVHLRRELTTLIHGLGVGICCPLPPRPFRFSSSLLLSSLELSDTQSL